MAQDLLKLARDVGGKPARCGQRFELSRCILPSLQLDTLIGKGLQHPVLLEDRLAECPLRLRAIDAIFGHQALQPAFALRRRGLQPHLVRDGLRQFQLQIGDALAVRTLSRRQGLVQRAGEATIELHAVGGPFRLDLLTLGFGLLQELRQATLFGDGFVLALLQVGDLALLIVDLPSDLLALVVPGLRARRERLIVSRFDLADRPAVIGVHPLLLALALPDEVGQALLFGDGFGVTLLEIGDLEPLPLVLLPDLFVLVGQYPLALGQSLAIAGFQVGDGPAVLGVDAVPFALAILDEL